MGRTTEAQKELRVNAIYALVVDGISTARILLFASQEAKWGVSERSVKSYIAEATKRMEALAKPRHKRELARALARRQDLWERNKKVQDYKACLEVEKDRAKIMGLYAPEEHRLTGPGGGPIKTQSVPVVTPETVAAFRRKLALEALAPDAPVSPVVLAPTNGNGTAKH